MRNTLFIGNGLNRTLDSKIEWGNLLKDIAREKGVSDDDNHKISFPLEFELMVNKILMKPLKPDMDPSDKIYRELKEKIANRIRGVKLPKQNGAPHYKFTALPVACIITTNYDYLLEESLDAEFKRTDSKPNNTKYNLNSKLEVAGKDICHIHGELDYPESICLGYEHYSGMLQNLRNRLEKKIKKKNGIHAISFALSNDVSTNIWTERFFTDNIYIVGFGLDRCEIDIWWLITYRALMYYSNLDGMKDLISNKIIFYDIAMRESPQMLEDNDNMKYALENLT